MRQRQINNMLRAAKIAAQKRYLDILELRGCWILEAAKQSSMVEGTE